MEDARTEVLADERPDADSADARPGQRIGKYVIRSRIGVGGCGTVYAAYDPVLERDVAIKLLMRTAPVEGATIDPGWPRLVREARMLARLSEPQVVTVYDVGDSDGQAYLAMEMVEGGDLKTWITEHRGPDAQDARPLSEVLDLLLQSGRGLAVAHEAGVVHGDFKPANVLIDARGRAKVSDFGIARLAEVVAEPRGRAADSHAEARLSATGPAGSMDDVAHTFTTSQGRPIVGTPAYMAPEQFGGIAADVASDVYAFCATLYHAVYGVLPFDGRTIAEVAARKSAGQLQPPTGAGVPSWLSKLLVRGLDSEREPRFADMATVLRQIELGRAPPRRRWFLLGGALGGAGLAAGVVAWPSDDPRCDDEASAEFPWNDSSRARVVQGLVQAGGPESASIVANVAARMDVFAADWTSTRQRACAAQWSEARLADLAFACLRRRRAVAAAMLDVWNEPEAGTATTALSAVAALPSVGACVDPEILAGQPDLPEDPQLREQVIAARERIDAVIATTRTGGPTKSLALAEQAHTEAEALGYDAVVAQSALALGQALEVVGEFEPSRQRLREAFFAAQRWDDHETAAQAAERLVYLVGTRLEEHDKGLLWVEHARVALAKTGGSTAVLASNEGSILERLGRYDEALARYREAIDAHGPDNVYGLGVTHLRMGDALRGAGHAEEALTHYDQAVARWAEALGPEHPRMAIPQQSRATALSRLGRRDEAIAAFELAIAGLSRMFGPDHINVGVGYVNLGITLKNAERYDEAETAMREALRITVAAYGEDHIKVAHRRDALGRLLTRIGQGTQAVAEHERAQAIYAVGLPEDHEDRTTVLMNLGEAHQAAGDHDKALELFEAAVARCGSDAERRGDAQAFLGRALHDAGRPEQARVQLREAVAALQNSDRYAATRQFAVERLAQLEE